MADDRNLERISAALDADGPLPKGLDVIEERFLEDSLSIRRAARLRTAEEPPDVSKRVLAEIGSQSSSPDHDTTGRVAAGRQVVLSGLAIFLIAALVGSVITGPVFGGQRSAAASLVDDALRAQADAGLIDATIDIVEWGWHPDVPVRNFTGRLRFEAPRQFDLELDDVTRYPDERWVPNDVRRHQSATTEWSTGRLGCPLDHRPGCLVAEPVVSHVIDVPPISALPLDAFVPVRALLPERDDVAVEREARAGRDEVIIRGTVARFDALFEALFAVGDWREYAPGDAVALHLDAETLRVTLLTVSATPGETRKVWAQRRGHSDEPGDVLLRVSIDEAAEPLPAFSEPELPAPVSGGFTAEPVDGLMPSWLPEGMEPTISGTSAGATTNELAGEGPNVWRSWSDGQSWITLRATRTWNEPRLFGQIGPVVVSTLTDVGPIHADLQAGRVAIHGADIDIEVVGTVPIDDLVRVAESLGTAALPIPADWLQGGAVSSPPAGVLVPAEPRAVAVVDGTVTVVVAGPGRSGFTLRQRAGTVLAPPSSPGLVAVDVRGGPGRHDPERHSIEWVEEGWVLHLVSEGATRDELVGIAVSLVRT